MMIAKRREYCFMSIVVLLLLVLDLSSSMAFHSAETFTGNGFTGTTTTSSQKGLVDTEDDDDPGEAANYGGGDYDYYRRYGDVPSPGVGH